MKKQLGRVKQCAKCPWRVEVNPNDIPNGYSKKKHKGLKRTIARKGEIDFCSVRHVMACHESMPGQEMHCIGWLHNQLGVGNNIGLRLKMMDYDLSKVELVGEQHETFEDTLP